MNAMNTNNTENTLNTENEECIDICQLILNTTFPPAPEPVFYILTSEGWRGIRNWD